MFALLLLSWWYGRGWLWVVEQSAERLHQINEIFSVSILLRTLFSPWKQIQTEKNFQNFIQSSLDNFISRFIGAFIRSFMLLSAFILSLLVLTGGLILTIAWPFIPLLVIGLPVLSLRTVVT